MNSSLVVKTFFCKLNPPRATFVQDMTEGERKLMQEHAAYWKSLVDQGKALTFGFVADPSGPHGMGILEVADDAEAQHLTDNDPTILSRRGFFFDIHPMPRGAVHR
jgi:hypothetical protein